MTPDRILGPGQTDWRQLTRALLVVLVTGLLATAIALWAYDQWFANPRSDRLEHIARQSVANGTAIRHLGENQCDFDLATARALHALASSSDLSDRQQQRLDEMVVTARHCRPPP